MANAPTVATVLRDLQVMRNRLKKVRQLLRPLRESARAGRIGEAKLNETLRSGWDELAAVLGKLAQVPSTAALADEASTQILALQRSAASLMVRLRRLARGDFGGDDADDGDDDGPA